MQVIRESTNLSRLTRFGLVNCFLVKEEDGFTLVDTNLSGSSNLILRIATSLGSPIRRILLTHAHFDHVASLDDLASSLEPLEIAIGAREARFLSGDFSLDPSERGKRLFGLKRARTRITRALTDGDNVGSLLAISTPGHTPGHFSYLDTRDNTLIVGDAFTNQMGLTAAGVFRWDFPLAALFAWNAELSAQSAAKLRDFRPSRLAFGHGRTLLSPLLSMNRAVALALSQNPLVSTPSW
jgi:glyoxylase-like metal-dependent hydrolase (beta-lactamase superfamily II)